MNAIQQKHLKKNKLMTLASTNMMVPLEKIEKIDYRDIIN